jgi:hypothetical protein
MSNTSNPNFGTDLSCTTDLTTLMNEVGGIQIVSEAIYRRLTTPRGANIWDPNYGFDLQTLLNDDVNPGDLPPLQQSIQQECLKDQRIIACQCQLQLLPLPSGVLIITLTLTTGLGPFSLVLSVSNATVAILSSGVT